MLQGTIYPYDKREKINQYFRLLLDHSNENMKQVLKDSTSHDQYHNR